MKKLLLSLLFTTPLMAAPYDWQGRMAMPSTGTFTYYATPNPDSDKMGFVLHDGLGTFGTAKRPAMVLFGNTFSFDNATKTINLSQTAIGGMIATNAADPASYLGQTLNGFSNLNPIKGYVDNAIANISLTPGPTGPQGVQGIQGIQGVPGVNATTTATATTSVNGLMSSSDKTKLDGIASGATANQTDAYLLNRSNHTGSQAISTVTDLQSTLDGKYPIPGGTVFQYIRGDGTLSTFPAIPSAQVNADWNSVSGVSQILNKPTLGTAASQNSTAFATSSQGSKADTAIQTATAPIVKNATDITLSAATTSSAGSMSAADKTKLDAFPSYQSRSFTATTPALNTAAQLDASRDTMVFYYVDVNVTSPLLAGTTSNLYLEYADNVGMTTNLVSFGPSTSAVSGILNLNSTGPVMLSAVIPAGKYRRIRTVNVQGTPTYTVRQSQEVKL